MSHATSNWNPRHLRKAYRKGSQTPGKDKGAGCRCSTTIAGHKKKYWAKMSRSYKISGYAQWCGMMDTLNGNVKRGND